MASPKHLVLEQLQALLARERTQPSLPRSHRAQYVAAINWLHRYAPEQILENADRVRGELEAFHHLCRVADWTSAHQLAFAPNRLLMIAYGTVGVAQVAKGLALAAGITHFAHDRQLPVQGRQRCFAVAQSMSNHPQVAIGEAGTQLIANLLGHGQLLLITLNRLGVLTGGAVHVAQVAQGMEQTLFVVKALGDRQMALMIRERLVILACHEANVA